MSGKRKLHRETTAEDIKRHFKGITNNSMEEWDKLIYANKAKNTELKTESVVTTVLQLQHLILPFVFCYYLLGK